MVSVARGLLSVPVFALITLEIVAPSGALKPPPKDQQASAITKRTRGGEREGRALLSVPVFALISLEIITPSDAVRCCHQLLWPSSAAASLNFERPRTVHLLGA